jgi:hypothetical protein
VWPRIGLPHALLWIISSQFLALAGAVYCIRLYRFINAKVRVYQRLYRFINICFVPFAAVGCQNLYACLLSCRIMSHSNLQLGSGRETDRPRASPGQSRPQQSIRRVPSWTYGKPSLFPHHSLQWVKINGYGSADEVKLLNSLANSAGSSSIPSLHGGCITGFVLPKKDLRPPAPWCLVQTNPVTAALCASTCGLSTRTVR